MSALQRPDGELLWCHATTTERLLGLCDIGMRLKTSRPDLMLALSWEVGINVTQDLTGCDIAIGTLDLEQPSEARAFFDYWQPDVCVWTGGSLRRLLLKQADELGIPSLLVDLRNGELPNRASRWLPDQRHRILNRFDEVLVSDPKALEQVRRLGVPEDKVRETGRLMQSATPPHCHDDDLSHLQSLLNSRPSWVAVDLSLTELKPILSAHRAAMRLLHRLLLVVTVSSEDALETARKVLTSERVHFADWESGDEPDEYCQVILSRNSDLGLWYRLCPVSFIGHSLIRGAKGKNPLDAAALGSAILHGPGTLAHRPAFERLTSAKAALMIYGEDELAEEVLNLSAPDKAAEMAVAAWQVVTESAALSDYLVDKVQELLDQREHVDATA